DLAMDRIASAVQREGLAPGDNVAIVSETDIACAMAFLGTLRAGCTPTPLPPSATAHQLLAMIADCRAPLVFASHDA
ncbi:AMP-binding protein, partial [Acinetobacter baumannii]